jgi:L-asparaginase II
MADPIRVLVRRGATVESVHSVHAVAVQGGAVVAERGDASLLTFMRSAAKPLQALPLVAAVPDLPEHELAIACASHLASPEQLAAVTALLVRAGAGEDELECGAEGDPPSRLRHNCSGKHAGMLLLSRVRGWSLAGYRLPEHPAQQAALATVAAAVDAAPAEIPTATDGCGVVTFALPLERMALAFSRLPGLDGGARVCGAMRARPELIRGKRSPDTVLMRERDGWTAKGGAEGVLCASGPDGVGVALKVIDGSGRAVGPALAAFLAELGHPLPSLTAIAVENSRGEVVGEVGVEAA